MKEILSKIFFVVFVLDRAMQSQIEFEIALIPDLKRGNYVELKTKPTIQMLTKAGTGERERRLKAAIKWWLVIKCRQNRIYTIAIHTRNTQIREIYEHNAHKKNIASICTSHTQIQYKPTCTVHIHQAFPRIVTGYKLDNGILGRQFMSTIEMHCFDH